MLQVGGHLPGIAQLVFVVLADRTSVGGLLEPIDERAVHHALAERAPGVLPTARHLFPEEVLHDYRGIERLGQPRLDRPRETAFYRGVADVETEPDVPRVQ